MMTHWQECPTCAQDFDVDRWGWNDETAEAWRLAKAAPDLLAACNKAANEFERLTGDNGFEPERFRERISIMHELNRAISEAGRR